MIRSDRAVKKCLAEGKQDLIYCRPWSGREGGSCRGEDSSAFPWWQLGAACRLSSSLSSPSRTAAPLLKRSFVLWYGVT